MATVATMLALGGVRLCRLHKLGNTDTQWPQAHTASLGQIGGQNAPESLPVARQAYKDVPAKGKALPFPPIYHLAFKNPNGKCTVRGAVEPWWANPLWLPSPRLPVPALVPPSHLPSEAAWRYHVRDARSW